MSINFWKPLNGNNYDEFRPRAVRMGKNHTYAHGIVLYENIRSSAIYYMHARVWTWTRSTVSGVSGLAVGRRYALEFIIAGRVASVIPRKGKGFFKSVRSERMMVKCWIAGTPLVESRFYAFVGTAPNTGFSLGKINGRGAHGLDSRTLKTYIYIFVVSDFENETNRRGFINK